MNTMIASARIDGLMFTTGLTQFPRVPSVRGTAQAAEEEVERKSVTPSLRLPHLSLQHFEEEELISKPDDEEAFPAYDSGDFAAL